MLISWGKTQFAFARMGWGGGGGEAGGGAPGAEQAYLDERHKKRRKWVVFR